MGRLPTMNSFLLALVATNWLGVQAQQDAVSGQQFLDDPLSVVAAAAPAWLLDQATCFPKAATDGSGPDPGVTVSTTDKCSESKLTDGCPKPPPFKGERTQSNPFPTYYIMQYCPDDQSWRTVYDVYFPKDTGHQYDWEWAAVKWKKQADGSFLRDGIWLEQDGDTPYVPWSDFSTYTNDDDIASSDKGKNHPKLYFGKWRHDVHSDIYELAANTCDAGNLDYRSNDYIWEAKDMLVDGTTINTDWTFGGKSVPSKFLKENNNGICGY